MTPADLDRAVRLSGLDDSATLAACRLVADGLAPYAAARTLGLSPSGVYRMLDRLREVLKQPTCPTCGQVTDGRIDQ